MQYQLCIYVQLILHLARHAIPNCPRRLFLHCMVVAIRLTYDGHPSPCSRGGCFVPDRAESSCLSYRPCRLVAVARVVGDSPYAMHLCSVTIAILWWTHLHRVTAATPMASETRPAFALTLYGFRNPINVWFWSLSSLTLGLFRSCPSQIRWWLSQLPSMSPFAPVCTLAAFRRM